MGQTLNCCTSTGGCHSRDLESKDTGYLSLENNHNRDQGASGQQAHKRKRKEKHSSELDSPRDKSYEDNNNTSEEESEEEEEES
jgi:hypothetical protein